MCFVSSPLCFLLVFSVLTTSSAESPHSCKHSPHLWQSGSTGFEPHAILIRSIGPAVSILLWFGWTQAAACWLRDAPRILVFRLPVIIRFTVVFCCLRRLVLRRCDCFVCFRRTKCTMPRLALSLHCFKVPPDSGRQALQNHRVVAFATTMSLKQSRY